MAFLATIALPAYVVAPSRSLSGGALFGLVVFVAFETVLLSIARRRVLLAVDEHGKSLTIRDLNWPLPERTDRVALAEIIAVNIQKAPRSPAVRIALVFRSGEERPLTQSYFAPGVHMDRDAAAIEAMCGSSAR